MKKINRSLLLTILFCSMLPISCSDNSTGNQGEELQNGSVSFLVSGDSNGNKNGTAVFTNYQIGATNGIDISMWDSPLSFTLSFSLFSTDALSVPSPGAYEIGQTFTGRDL